jgi:hypothetical protein
MDGWRRVGLDDAFLIKQALPVGARFWCWARWARLSIEIIVYYSRYNIYTSILPHSMAPERRAWVDDLG